MKIAFLYRLVFATFLAAALLSLPGCKTSILAQRGPYLHAYHDGDLIQAEQRLDKLMVEEDYQNFSESSWVLLDRATTRFAMGKVDDAIQDYSKALESLDYYSQDLTMEECAKILLQDEMGAYQASDFEQVLARVYFALALLHRGDEGNAFALLRQTEEYQQEKRQLYSAIPFTRDYHLVDNGLSKYLFALLLERHGDASNANILYGQARQLIPSCNSMSFQANANLNHATVLLVCHNGNAPYKISATSPASVASAYALELLLASHNIDPAWSTLTGIPVPALADWPGSTPSPIYAALAGINKPLLPCYNVRNAAVEELEQRMPLIVARGVARLLSRRAAVGYLNRQDPCLGMIADFTMLMVNDHTRADTRSWTTLPALIDTARFELEPGQHSLTIQANGDVDQCHYILTLKPNDLCIIHIFNIHPGIRQILIPNRFLATVN